ncbi:MAG TPA: hypothetical protein VKG63_14515 [Steroidobacteraceae bacterium]|nr:hypothetical protein [Steroidobacteraceae bacterium]
MAPITPKEARLDALALIPESDRERAIALARDYGIVPRTADTLEFARRARVLLLKHEASAIDMDVILGGLAFEHSAVNHAEIHDHPEVNVDAVRRWVREFSVATAMSDLLDDFDKAVARRVVRPRKSER